MDQVKLDAVASRIDGLARRLDACERQDAAARLDDDIMPALEKANSTFPGTKASSSQLSAAAEALRSGGVAWRIAEKVGISEGLAVHLQKAAKAARAGSSGSSGDLGSSGRAERYLKENRVRR